MPERGWQEKGQEMEQWGSQREEKQQPVSVFGPIPTIPFNQSQPRPLALIIVFEAWILGPL